jgi:hypothetical protein
MTVRIPKQPKYRLHKARNVGVVTIDGRDYYLGPYDSPESHEAYARLISEWRSNGCRLPAQAATTAEKPMTLNELMLDYWGFVERHYVKNGKPTSEQETIRCALRFVRQLYGSTAAKDFGPLKLKAVREEMVRHPITCKYKAKDPETGEVKVAEKVVRVGLARPVSTQAPQKTPAAADGGGRLSARLVAEKGFGPACSPCFS